MLAVRLAASLGVLSAAWAAVGTCLEGWRALGPPPAVVRPRSGDPPDIIGAALSPGGYWRIGDSPWLLKLSDRPTAAAPDAARLVEGLPDDPDAGVELDGDLADALRRLTLYGAVERTVDGKRSIWELAKGQTRIALALRREGGRPVRLLAGTASRQDPKGGRWSTYSLVPRQALPRPFEPLLPESAAPIRVASRCDARGETLLEVAEVADPEFLRAGVESAESATRGLRKFRDGIVRGRAVSYHRGPYVRSRPTLVLAVAED